jgi:hypothetical protein
MPDLETIAKWGAGSIGIILAGAMGSGIWSLILEPLVKKIGKFLVWLSTLGIKSIQDAIYRQVARRGAFFAERLTMFIVALIVLFPYLYAMSATIKSHQVIEIKKQIAPKIKSEHPEMSPFDLEEMTLNEAKKQISNENQSRFMYGTIGALIVISIMFFQFARRVIIHEKIIYFDKICAVAAPILSDRDLKAIKARFVFIRSKEDYDEIISDLKQSIVRWRDSQNKKGQHEDLEE